MYDPSVGRWMQEDPIGFEGGDTNLFGYVQNNPTNFTDPTGLIFGMADLGQAVPKEKFGGGKVTFPGEKATGSIQVWVNGRSAQYHPDWLAYEVANLSGVLAQASPPGLGSATLGPAMNTAASLQAWGAFYPVRFKAPAERFSRPGAIFILYEGPHAGDVEFVQLVHHSVKYKAKGKDWEYWEAEYDGTGIYKNKTEKFTTNPKNENQRHYYLDVSGVRPPKTPIYTSTIDRPGSTGLVDTPNSATFSLGRFLASKEIKEKIKEDNWEDVVATSHFDTFLVYKGKALYRISWESSDTLKRLQQDRGNKLFDPNWPGTPPRVSVTGGGPNPKVTDRQLKAINDAYPGQTTIGN